MGLSYRWRKLLIETDSKRESCVYNTWYKGDLMPGNYIGSAYTDNIENGYHGSVASTKYGKIWVKEIKENPHLFETEILMRFTNRNEATDFEAILQKKLDVIRSDLFINECYANHGWCDTDKVSAIDTETGKKVKVDKNEFYKNPRYVGVAAKKVSAKDTRDGLTKSVSKEDFDKYDYYVGVTHGMVTAKDTRDGSKKSVTKEDFDKYDYYVGATTGYVTSDEAKKKISKSQKGIPKPQKRVSCPHCGKIGGMNAMTHHHFDNCKHRYPKL